MAELVIFDDARGDFGPMADLRAAFEIRTGMLTNAGRIANALRADPAGFCVPPHLRDVVADRASAPVNELPEGDDVLLVNGRWTLPDAAIKPQRGEALVDEATGDVVIARLSASDARQFVSDWQLPDSVRAAPAEGVRLARFPWHIMEDAKRTIAGDILHVRMTHTRVLQDDAPIVGEHPVEVHETVRMFPNVVLDATQGPISIHQNVTIRPGAVICGPCSIGRGSTVLDHAIVKPHCAIGPVCKIAGEVGAVIFQGYANKAHDGHLGDSWVGKWVNFGAGTTSSNLLNTYGEIVMRLEPDGPRHRTGSMYLGAIIGDHAKFAICTRLMTGTAVGTGAMIATTTPAPTTVPPFAWLTDDGERVYRIDKFLDVMKTVMARRDITPTDSYVAAVRALHARSAGTS